VIVATVMTRTKNSTVEIKGQKDGLWIYLDDQVSIPDLLSALEQKLAASNNFFSGAEVSINTGARQLSPDEDQQIRDLIERTYTLRIKEIIFTESQEEEQEDTAALPDEELDNIVAEDEFMKVLDETFRIPLRPRRDQQQYTYSPDYLYENEESAFYFRGTVRSGQTLEFPGNIVILGDVNPGAYVIASGDIIVIGRLNGVVHAGAEGEERAVVIGAKFNPSQLRIAHYIGRSPDENPHSSGGKRPQTEKAYIKDGAIVIEPVL
jgi:septum site-determining protein MinC